MPDSPNLLVQYLEKTGKTQHELAAEVGESQPQVSKWAAGYARPSLESAIRIEQVTGIPAAYWLSVPRRKQPKRIRCRKCGCAA